MDPNRGVATAMEQTLDPAGRGGTDGMLIDDLVRAMTTGSEPMVPGDVGFRSALICLGIDEARRTGTVVDMEPWWQRFAV